MDYHWRANCTPGLPKVTVGVQCSPNANTISRYHWRARCVASADPRGIHPPRQWYTACSTRGTNGPMHRFCWSTYKFKFQGAAAGTVHDFNLYYYRWRKLITHVKLVGSIFLFYLLLLHSYKWHNEAISTAIYPIFRSLHLINSSITILSVGTDLCIDLIYF